MEELSGAIGIGLNDSLRLQDNIEESTYGFDESENINTRCSYKLRWLKVLVYCKVPRNGGTKPYEIPKLGHESHDLRLVWIMMSMSVCFTNV